MKKILVVLLVLAVAGGVFAQEGSWSVKGMAEIGSFIDFDNDPDPDHNDEPAVVHSSGYFSPYNYYGMRNGQFGINYSLGGLGAGVELNALDGDRIMGDINYDGENFKFQVKSSLQQLIAGTPNVDRLWGSYELVNGLIHLEVAYNSRDTEDKFWTSDRVAGFYGDGAFGHPVVNVGKVWYQDTTLASAVGITWTPGPSSNDALLGADKRGTAFSHADHGNFLLADVVLENLSFGVMLPRLFWDPDYTHQDNAVYYKYLKYDSADKDDRAYADAATFPKAVAGPGSSLLIDDILKKMVFGVKFQMQPVEFAAQILMDDYAVYFGGRVYFGALTVGASFMGIMFPTDDNGDRIDGTIVRVGGSLSYSADAFGAGLTAWYGIEGYKADSKATQLGVEPYFFYNVIPTHLQFRADVGFYFNNVYLNGSSEKDDDYSNIIWGIQPQLFWNFLGTGAGTYYSFNTGMIVRYRMLKEANNALDVTFKLSF